MRSFPNVRFAVAPAIALAAGMAGGCRSYSPRPLDLGAHGAAVLQRTPDAPEVAAFARRLAAQDAGQRAPFDPGDGLSLSEAEAVALVFNPDLRIARQRAGVSEAAAVHAGLWEDPVLSTDLTRIIQSAEHPWKVFATLGLTIPLSGRLEMEKKRSAEEHRADIVRAWALEWARRIELRRAWVEWSAASERAAVMRELIERLDPIVGIVDRIEQAGVMSRVEARLFKIERAVRGGELAALELAEAQGALAIKRLLGLSPAASVRLTPGLGAGNERVPDDGRLERLAMGNPELAITKVEYEVTERSLELEVRKQYPDLIIGPGYGREDGQDQFLLGLSIPLPILNRNQQGIAVATAERELARAEHEATYERLAADLAAAEARQGGAAAQRENLESVIVPLVDEQYDVARRIAERGEVNTFALLETLIRQQDVKFKLIDSRAAESLARVRIEELLGPKTEPPAGPSLQEGGVR